MDNNAKIEYIKNDYKADVTIIQDPAKNRDIVTYSTNAQPVVASKVVVLEKYVTFSKTTPTGFITVFIGNATGELPETGRIVRVDVGFCGSDDDPKPDEFRTFFTDGLAGRIGSYEQGIMIIPQSGSLQIIIPEAVMRTVRLYDGSDSPKLTVTITAETVTQ